MASTVRGFEAKLDKFWKDQPVKNSTSEKVRRAPNFNQWINRIRQTATEYDIESY